MEMDTEENSSSRHRRIITVKKKKPATTDHGGIGKFDEYIQRSGLEPKSYQREGVEFCLRREAVKTVGSVRGGIIADEMGLGKTIVMMGLILANIASQRRTLIVVPVALIAQWIAQLKHTIIDTGVKSDLSVFVFHGSAGKRRVVLSETRDGIVWCHRPPKKAAAAAGSSRAIDIVITTYGCVAMEEPAAIPAKKTAAATLSLITFCADRIIFDEAHHLRNKNSRIFKGAMRVVTAATTTGGIRPSVWIVTGTPIQNKISDLKSLCYVLGFGVDDLNSDEKRRMIREEYVLRRTKVSVGMVAAETETEAAAAAEAAEAAEVVCAPRLQSLKHYKSQVPWESENELALSREIHHQARNTTDRTERLKLYTRMRQMCVWPALVGTSSSSSEYGLSMEEYKVAISKQSKLDRVIATMAAAAESAEVRKSLVFCHYRREMTHLRDMLLRGGVVASDDDVAIIDGRVTARERQRILAAVPKVLILQIRTCSEGLNLQSYSNVYFISPHWNPCVEDQAIARCYRMGQTSQVRVFRFYMTDFVMEGGGDAGAAAAVAGKEEEEEEVSGAAGAAECISTLDHKCEEIQERKRMLCNEFLCM
jgi:SNF2 family DNA or RNA helicase